MVSLTFRVSLLILTFLASAPIAGQENLQFQPPPEWERGNLQQTKDAMLMESVKKGEKVDNWTELLTLQQFRRPRGSPTARQFYDQLKAARGARRDRVEHRG